MAFVNDGKFTGSVNLVSTKHDLSDSPMGSGLSGTNRLAVQL